MNALILSAILGVILMFSGILLKQKAAIRNIAIAGMVLLLVVNVMEMYGTVFLGLHCSLLQLRLHQHYCIYCFLQEIWKK